MTLRVRRFAVAAATFVGVVAFGAGASAAPSARLVYLRNPGAETCPDEAAIRAAVAARLGYDPFFPYAPATMFAEVSKDGDSFKARIKLVDDSNVVRGARELSQPGGNCADMIDTMAVSISIAIDPLSLTRPKDAKGTDAEPSPAVPNSPPVPTSPPVPPEQPPRDASPSAPPAPRAVVDDRPSDPVHLEAGIGPGVWIGAAPAASLAATGFGRLRWERLSLGVEGRFDLPSSTTLPSGAIVETSLAYGLLVPCVHFGAVGLCVAGAAGSLRATSRAVTFPREASGFHAAVGPRVEGTVPVGERLGLWARVDGLITLTPQNLQLNGTNVYALSRLSAGASVGVSVRFF
jgi:hypothetical protein